MQRMENENRQSNTHAHLIKHYPQTTATTHMNIRVHNYQNEEHCFQTSIFVLHGSMYREEDLTEPYLGYRISLNVGSSTREKSNSISHNKEQ